MPLTAEQVAQAKSLGIDLSKIDWTKIVAIIQLLVQLFAAQQQQLKASAKAAGCADEHADLMHGAICDNLNAADKCLRCCCG